MGMLDWFRRRARADATAPGDDAADTALAERGAAEYGGLDFYKAIEAHQRWKVRLAAHIRGESTERLDWQVVCRDDQCALGQWLHQGARVPEAQHAMFTRLIAEHAEFHRRAGEVVQLVDDGQRERALRQITNGDYARASHRVVASLSQLFLELNETRRNAG
jgi:hypothetical protein